MAGWPFPCPRLFPRTHPVVWRTEDGSASWSDLDLGDMPYDCGPSDLGFLEGGFGWM